MRFAFFFAAVLVMPLKLGWSTILLTPFWELAADPGVDVGAGPRADAGVANPDRLGEIARRDETVEGAAAESRPFKDVLKAKQAG